MVLVLLQSRLGQSLVMIQICSRSFLRFPTFFLYYGNSLTSLFALSLFGLRFENMMCLIWIDLLGCRKSLLRCCWRANCIAKCHQAQSTLVRRDNLLSLRIGCRYRGILNIDIEWYWGRFQWVQWDQILGRFGWIQATISPLVTGVWLHLLIMVVVLMLIRRRSWLVLMILNRMWLLLPLINCMEISFDSHVIRRSQRSLFTLSNDGVILINLVAVYALVWYCSHLKHLLLMRWHSPWCPGAAHAL